MASADIFNTKYEEFARDLGATCPELATQLQAALALSIADRKKEFRAQVIPSCSPSRDSAKVPSVVLPGVPMPQEIWESLSEKSKRAIQEYLTILAFCVLLDTEGPLPEAGAEGAGFTADWAAKMMEEMKAKMSNVDFSGISKKIAELFQSDVSGGGAFPKLPEKFLKGQIAKLAEEIVKEFRVEDFGLDPAAVEAAGNDPNKAMSMMMDVFLRNPQAIQTTIMKLTKKLQQKVQSGALRPQELVAEAEELMKTFSENSQFVEMMETFRQAFGMEGHEEELSNAGQDGKARLSLVQQRLRKKLEAKKRGGKK